MVDTSKSYRIKNNFEGSNDSFWYSIHSNEKELNSNCQNQTDATVYNGTTINKHINVIREYKNAKLIMV